MSDKLDFSLPEKKKKLPVILPVILVILIVSLGLNITALVFNLDKPGKSAEGITPDAQKDIALRLQKNSVFGASIAAWKDYLKVSSSTAKDRAAIWYTIGDLYQEAGDFEMALDSYYKSEATFQRDDLKDEISRKIQICLESLGKFAALRYELDDRVGLNDGDKGNEVLAEIGTQKITRGDLDRKIEEYINLQTAQYAAFMDKDSLNRQKEELFKRFAGEEGQMQMLNQFVVEELLYRRAREVKLADEPVTRALLKDTERKVLAQQLVSKEMAKINISEQDLKTYYDARKGDYIEEGVQKPFEEVKNDIYKTLLEQKEQAGQQQLLEELRQAYNVVIHPAKQSSKTDGSDGK